LNTVCRLFGVSRQANYQYLKSQTDLHSQHELLVQQVLEIRNIHPRIGTRKLFFMLQPFFKQHNIQIGRDALFNLLSVHKLLVRKRIRKVTTTYSQHWMRKWPNLIKSLHINAPNQLWVSDITYWRVSNKFLYISFITDAYSHKIVGYNLSEHLDMRSARNALQMALNNNNTQHQKLIHHSDRGVQYCAMDYVKLLHQNNIKISMTENGDPRDNAIAERLNGIIKNEYLFKYKPKTYEQAQALLQRSVNSYNESRPHLSNNLMTPQFIHQHKTKTTRLWKNYFKTIPVNIIQD
jgi:putative transposase